MVAMTMNLISRLCARIAALFALLLALPACALDPAPQMTAAPVAEAEVKPALWKVADGDTTIWLFGTVHALPEGIDWYRGPIADAFRQSRELVTEIVPPEPSRMQAIVVSKAMLPKGETLRATLSPEERARYEATLAAQGLPLTAFDAFEPWYAAVGLSTLPLLRDGFASANGVEQALETQARNHGLTHSALETAEYQLGLFDTLPARTQRTYLDEVIRNLPTMKEQLLRMVEAWKTGDAVKLAELINQDEDDPELLRVLLIERNRNWADWIGKRMERPGTVFLAVGAGHLAGTGSVQEQLARAGVTVTRVQ